jgi:hypothetical protein
LCQRRAAVLTAIVLAVGATHAEERGARVALDPAYQQECSACHIAYPPAMLSADSWQRLMGTLPQHFGSDASLDPKTTAALTSWLTANAARGRRARDVATADRITHTHWFVHEHEEVSADVWQRASVRSAANCAACHTGAARGDFNDDNIHIPK